MPTDGCGRWTNSLSRGVANPERERGGGFQDNPSLVLGVRQGGAAMLDLTAIPQLARNLSRLVEIVRTLAKYGLADGVARLDYRFVRRVAAGIGFRRLLGVSHEARIRLALTDLGTTFIK